MTRNVAIVRLEQKKGHRELQGCQQRSVWTSIHRLTIFFGLCRKRTSSSGTGTIRECLPILGGSPPKNALTYNAANFRLSACLNSVGTPANLTYLRSAASCCCVCLSAAITAARNESLLAGACTSPDSVSRKETFLP